MQDQVAKLAAKLSGAGNPSPPLAGRLFHWTTSSPPASAREVRICGRAAIAVSDDKGFVPIAYTPGVILAYSTAPGKTAADTGSGGEPYAKALTEELAKPGVEATTVSAFVSLGVRFNSLRRASNTT